MNIPRIVSGLRIKNEERWIEKTLESLSEICSEIVILDDGSTDNTVKICKSFPKVVDIHSQSNLPFDEARDRNTVLQMALKQHPDFFLTIDGDEIIQKNAREILLEELLVLYPDAPMFEFYVLVMWDKMNQYRYDGVYSNIWAKKLIRMSLQPKNLAYPSTALPGNLHGTLLPTNSIGWEKSVRSRMKIFHYGNYDEELRQRKYKFYTTKDPNNKFFDEYIHIISEKGKFSGPDGMKFKFLPNDVYISGIE